MSRLPHNSQLPILAPELPLWGPGFLQAAHAPGFPEPAADFGPIINQGFNGVPGFRQKVVPPGFLDLVGGVILGLVPAKVAGQNGVGVRFAVHFKAPSRLRRGSRPGGQAGSVGGILRRISGGVTG